MTPERTAREQSTTVVDVPAHARTLDTTTHDAARWLATLPESVLSWRPSATAWSIKEIIGHLIDSAAHNHQRFVRAELQADLVFPGYDQDDWVRAQAYHSAPWGPLLTLWQSYNLHLARVMAMESRFCTPRMIMQRWRASMTTATPEGCKCSAIASAIWEVIRS